MTAQLLASKTVVQEEPPSLRTITGTSTADAASVGVCERGPVGVATLTTSYEEWRSIFGGHVANGTAAAAAAGFYNNGGQVLWQTRTVHYTDIANAATKTSAAATLNLQTPTTAAFAGSVTGTNVAPFALTPGDTLSFSIDGGGSDVATIDAAAATITAGSSPTYALSDGQTLTVDIDNGGVQTVTFNTAEFVDIANATGAEVAAVINAELTGASCDLDGGDPRITSDLLGTDSEVHVTGGTANGALGFSTTPATGTGDVADITAVTVAELKTVIEADVTGVTINDVSGTVQAVSNTTGASSSVQVEAVSTADDEIGFDNATHSGGTGAAANTLTVNGKYDGTYGNGIRILVEPATSGTATEFNLTVEEDGVNVEVFPNLTLGTTTAANYAPTVINDADNGSRLIAVVDLALSTDPSAARPANSPGTPATPYGPLTGGDDGLTSLADTDFIGDSTAKTGIRSFDTKQNIRLLFIPDRPTSAVHNAMITYCEVTRDLSMFAVLDSPAGLTAEGINTYVLTTASLTNISEFGAIYWPQIKVVNPSTAVFGSGSTITVPPSGHIAGMYARTDGSQVGGVYQPPAGIERGRLFGAVGFETEEVLEEARRDLVFPNRINPISREPNQPIAVDGARTLKGGGNFPSVSERRGVIFIEQSIKGGVAFARNSNNDAKLRSTVERTINGFLLTQMRAGAFRSSSPAQAFFVDVSDALNPPSEVFAGRLNARIGLATQKPAEFIILSFSQDTRALDEELAAAAG